MQAILAANATDASFPARIPTVTSPTSNAGFVNSRGLGTLDLIGFGTGNDDTTFKTRIIGWTVNGNLWVPTILCESTWTLSTLTGISGQVPSNTMKLADIVTSDQGIGVPYTGTSNAQPAHIIVGLTPDFAGIEAIFNMNSSATDANLLYSLT